MPTRGEAGTWSERTAMDDLRRLREEWSAESERHWRDSESRKSRIEGQEAPNVELSNPIERLFLAYREESERRFRALEAEVHDLRQRVRELERKPHED